MMKRNKIAFAMFFLPFFSNAANEVHDTNSSSFLLGVGIHPNEWNFPEDKMFLLLNIYHFNSFRTDYHWSNIERKKGIYTVPQSNDESTINYLGDKKIKPLIILGYSNPIYSGTKPIIPETVSGFCNFAAWTVKHFYNKQPIFEIWNEWSIDPNNQKQAKSFTSALQYVELVKSCSERMKAIDPNVKIIAGSFNPHKDSDLKWGMYLVKLGIMNYIDGLSLHSYNFSNNKFLDAERDVSDIVKLNANIKNALGTSLDIPIYITEVGVPTFYRCKFTPEMIGLYAQQFISNSRKYSYIKGVWWYDLINDGNSYTNGEMNFGLYYHNLNKKINERFFY